MFWWDSKEVKLLFVICKYHLYCQKLNKKKKINFDEFKQWIAFKFHIEGLYFNLFNFDNSQLACSDGTLKKSNYCLLFANIIYTVKN